MIRRALPLLRSALAWLRERWRRLEDSGVTEANVDAFVGDLRDVLHEPTQEMPTVPRPRQKVTRIVRRRHPVTRVHWCDLPADPDMPIPIADEAWWAVQMAGIEIRTQLLEVAR